MTDLHSPCLEVMTHICFQQLLGVYSVSKTALLGLTKAAAKDLASENIRVNCVAPGIVITKFSAAVSTSCCSLTIRNKVFLLYMTVTSCSNLADNYK